VGFKEVKQDMCEPTSGPGILKVDFKLTASLGTLF
jgi:hypothetical protein